MTSDTKKYSLQNSEHKPYFGTYLNLAQHNAFLILNDINLKLGGKALKEEDDLLNKQNNRVFAVLHAGKPEEKSYCLDLLEKFLPFVRIFIDKNAQNPENIAKKIYTLLHSALDRLSEERNFYSHYKNQNRTYPPFYDSLEVTDQEECLNKIQQNFIDFLGEDDSEQRKIAIRLYYELIDQTETAEKTQKQAKKQVLKGLEALQEVKESLTDNPLKSTLYKTFKTFLKKDTEILWDKNKPQAFSEKGLVFFMCLFLDKKTANLFISDIFGLTNTTTPLFRMVRAMYLHHCCFLPQPRLESSEIMLDMLNELQKAPQELKNLLAENDKEKLGLLKKIQNPYVQTTQEDGNLKQIEEFFRNSKDKRFPYFALRYFEETKAFSKMRFQVYLGKLVTDYYPKKMQGEAEDRYLLDNIFVYQNLSEINEDTLKKEQAWDIFKAEYDEKGIATNSTKAKSGQIVSFSPHYHFGGTDDGRIALKLNPSPIPKIQQKSEQKNGRTLYELSEKNIQADAYISTDELSDLFLYYYLEQQEEQKKKADKNYKKTLSQNAEIFIKRYCEEFKKLFKDLKEGTLQPIEAKKLGKRKITKKDLGAYFHKRKSKESDEFVLKKYLPYDQAHFEDLTKRKKILQKVLDEKYKIISVDYLPDEVQRYLLGFYPLDYRKEVLGKLKMLKTETQKRQKQLEKQLERQQAKDYNPKKDLKQGKIADFLAADIIYLKPYAKPQDRKNPKQGKPNNDQFRRLQQLLAQYGGHKNELSKFFADLGLINGNVTHPFLGQVLDKYGNMPNTLFQFYEIYLAKRANYFGYHKENDKKTGVYELIEGKYNRNTKKFTGGLADSEINLKFGHLFSFALPPKNATQKNYENKPIMLPKGLFRKKIAESLQKMGYQVKENDNSVFGLNQFLNESQIFYQADRHYRFKENTPDFEQKTVYEKEAQKQESREVLLKKLGEKIAKLAQELDKKGKNASKKDQDYFLALRDFRKHILETEKNIRIAQHQDRCLWLMAKDLAKKRTEQGVENISFEGHKLTTIHLFLGTYIEMQVRQIKDYLPLKNYGDLRRFAKDRRLPNFFEYFPNQIFSKIQIEYALDYLDNHRHEVLENAMLLEKTIHKKWGLKDEKFENSEFWDFWQNGKYEKTHIGHRVYIDFLAQKMPELFDEHFTKDILQKFRDKICHNEIPFNDFLKNSILPIASEPTAPDYGKIFMQKLLRTILEVYEAIFKEL